MSQNRKQQDHLDCTVPPIIQHCLTLGFVGEFPVAQNTNKLYSQWLTFSIPQAKCLWNIAAKMWLNYFQVLGSRAYSLRIAQLHPLHCGQNGWWGSNTCVCPSAWDLDMCLCHLECDIDITLDIMWQFKGFLWLEFESDKVVIIQWRPHQVSHRPTPHQEFCWCNAKERGSENRLRIFYVLPYI